MYTSTTLPVPGHVAPVNLARTLPVSRKRPAPAPRSTAQLDGAEHLWHRLPLIEQDGLGQSSQGRVGIGFERPRLHGIVECDNATRQATRDRGLAGRTGTDYREAGSPTNSCSRRASASRGTYGEERTHHEISTICSVFPFLHINCSRSQPGCIPIPTHIAHTSRVVASPEPALRHTLHYGVCGNLRRTSPAKFTSTSVLGVALAA